MKVIKRAFSIRCVQRFGFKATVIEANDAANAAKQYAQTHDLGNVLLPLRSEHPTRVFTNNAKDDYLADQWSASTDQGFRLWIYN